jgi:hypothetical protein
MVVRPKLAPPVTLAYLEPALPPSPMLAKDGDSPVPGTLTNRPKKQE